MKLFALYLMAGAALYSLYVIFSQAAISWGSLDVFWHTIKVLGQ